MSSSNRATAVSATVTGTTAAGHAPAGATTVAGPRPETGARTDEAAALIGDARRRIDDLDGRIIGLVQERMAVSAVIQKERIASGGRRVNLSREMEVLEHFREQLGRPGTALAMTLLELCRGRI
ncbi:MULTISPECIES: chorismate mutase [Streptomyces]|uniref:Chorismate mutase domain-containing protein n=1 Tax=Streptomyces olivaceiscleroticus TaxID=68245 RepID=A0ABN1B2Q3_9ACTN|nr:chorismate mutase [Streptomyces niger]